MLLDAKNLKLRRGDRVLFESLSLSVQPGELWVIEGPSGIGKSSLLKILTGEIQADAGVVQRFSTQAEIPQDLALNPDLSFLENASVGLRKNKNFWSASFGISRALRRDLKEELRSWKLPYPDQSTSSASGGERQRIAWVRACFEDWQILFADEPISSLDEATAEKVLQAIRLEIQKRQGAAVVVLHHQNLIQKFATHRLDLTKKPRGTPL